ncbi:Dolichyl-phosphate-mannose--protein mannosyltransferase 1 [Wickerhamiella sorbophila]|uniref:Dolichyl-phosphate-mannose--protein mannosyltransferase n=1 Tax=Wickerhamiella sorbophila TaxID=45607 RepID=A0A2T0FJW1_9ASCO|nr:Dolichyl-phosphate-mannose--protein mannosyltransferase 1 [Wickerhamiella sorbophila]PRT55255.1 Dolichyl-phosphate-mannose--protein mannosyltransferase 1 [Wickerhamiella sorbophila]
MTSKAARAEKRKLAKPFRSTTVDAGLAQERSLSWKDRKILFVVMIIACVVRLYKLNWPNAVVFDEVHFGGFARKYIIGRMFFDVHPPLAKMLFAVVGWLGGYDGEFTFENIGMSYEGHTVPYVTMRLFPSLMGLMTIGLCFSTLRASGVRTGIAGIAALLLTFENTHATESRYILLDSPLLFFIALTAYNFKKFENEVPFGKNWYRYLFLTGIGLATTVSSKWVGLFTIAWVGVLTVWQLWWIFGDLSVPLSRFAKQFAWRAICLIAVPIVFYMGMFWLHFFCVDNDGAGADFMPREFQAHLKHNSVPANIPADVYLGSKISIRHLNTAGGYLHSHPYLYETGSKQQQITLYPHIDENNVWLVENSTEVDLTTNHLLKDNDVIRLFHVETQHRLHSHDHRPPVTTHDYLNEVSAYGFEGFEGDANDNWRIKIIDKQSVGEGKDHVQAIRTIFQLEHTMTGCLLYSKKSKLPEWGFSQQEVACIKNGRQPNTLWFVEQNELPASVEASELVSYPKMSFLSKFFAMQGAMWRVNKGLTESHPWESRPESWPILRRGINMWGAFHRQVYLLGNLPIYWGIVLLIVLYVCVKVVQIIKWQRADGTLLAITGQKPEESATCKDWAKFDANFGSYLLGWALHYFPSFLMVRQLFLHHYLASVYFGVLAIGQAMELVVAVVKPAMLGRAIVALFAVASIAWFAWYSPLIYGTPWLQDVCHKSKFADMDFDCYTFFGTKEEYTEYDATAFLPEATPSSAGEPEDTDRAPETFQNDGGNAVGQDTSAEPEPSVETLINEEPPQGEIMFESDNGQTAEEVVEEVYEQDVSNQVE